MTTIVDECAHHCLLPDGQSSLYDALPTFDEDLGGDVTAEELSLPPPLEAIDENHNGTGSSLPATPAERPCTFCPSSLPLPSASCPERATLVLDLDGTLIASEELNAANSTYLWSPHAGSRAPDYEAMGRRVWLRPGVKEFLTAVRPHFEIVLFTAATQNWAAAAVEQLDPAAELFDVMLHRDHTTSDLMWDYVKDLSRLGRDLARVVIVDDNPLMFMYQPDNALQVGAYEASMAGGADNVLERVAELLVNKVASADDVREILGPMASAKSCIISTVSSTSAATVPGVPAELHGDQQSDAVVSTVCCTVASDATADGCSVGARLSVALELGNFAVGSDGQTDCTTGLSCSAEDGCESGLQHQEQQQPQQEEDIQQCPNGSAGSATADEELAAWECDSDGAETFDANGAAAQLGADVGQPVYRHRDWEHGADGNAQAAATAGEQTGMSHGGVEQEESDASPVEDVGDGHTGHSSEDFEALMADAIAEYDSDTYDDRCVKDPGYDGGCPASTATIGPYSSAADPCDGFGRLGRRSMFDSDNGRYRCGVPDCSFGSSYGVEVLAGCEVTEAVQHSAGSALDGPAPFTLHQTRPDCDLGTADLQPAPVAPHSAASTGTEGKAQSAGVYMETHILACGEATALGATTSAGPPGDSTLVQSRQSSLPSGMVFLTDLNPSLGSGCASADADGFASAGHAEQEQCQVGDAVPAGPRQGSKRSRDEMEMLTTEQQGGEVLDAAMPSLCRPRGAYAVGSSYDGESPC